MLRQVHQYKLSLKTIPTFVTLNYNQDMVDEKDNKLCPFFYIRQTCCDTSDFVLQADMTEATFGPK